MSTCIKNNMKQSTGFSFIFFLLLILIIGNHAVEANNIIGNVYDSKKAPLQDVDVELMDDLSRTIARTRTDDNGRYEFSGLGNGRFSVRVLPFRYDLDPQEQTIELSSITSIPGQVTSLTETRDFYLSPRRGSIVDVEARVVFAQEVPKEAEDVYNAALTDLKKKRIPEGIAGLRRAIELFPDYYLALQGLGREYLGQQRYGEAVPFLVQAARINDKSPLSFYSLGYCLHKLGYHKAAIVALERAGFLSPASASIFYYLGTSERMEGKYTDAEVHLKQSKRLARGPFPDLHWQLALLYGENLKRYAEGADEFETFLKEQPLAKDAEKIRRVIENYRKLAKKTK